MPSTNTLRVLSCNARSLSSQIDAVKELIKDSSCNILALQEIWNIRSGNYLEIPGFELIYCQRKKSTGGGVGFYIKDDLNFQIVDSYMQEKILECQTIKITLTKQTYYFTSIYMGHQNKNESLNKLRNYLNKNKELKSHYILGDLNINLLDNSQLTLDLENILIDFNFRANCNLPTRFDQRNGTMSATLIDNIFSNTLNQGVYRILTDPIADHLCLSLDLPLKRNQCLNNEVKYKTIKKFQPDAINNIKTDLNSVNWDHMLGQNINYNVDFLTNTLNKIVNNYTITKKIKLTNNMENKWFTPGLRKSKIKLRKLHKKSIIKPSNTNTSNYKAYYKVYKNLLRHAKTTYYKTELTNAWGESRKLWSIINEMSGRLNKDTKAIKIIKSSTGQILTSQKAIADRFGKYFSNVGSDINNKFKTDDKYIDRLCKEKRDKTLHLKCIGISHVNKIIKSLRSKYSSGNDEINNVLLKQLSDQISRPLMFGHGQCQGTYPGSMALITKK